MPTDALATGTHRVAFGPVADFVEAAAGVGASPTALSGTLAPALTASYPRKSLVSRGHSEVDEREAEAVAGGAHQDLKREAPVIAQQRLDGVEVEHELREANAQCCTGADPHLVAWASEGVAAPAGVWLLLSRLVLSAW